MKKFWFILIPFAAVFCGCAKESAPVKPAHIMRISINREPSTLDPRKGGDLIASTIHFILYEGLMRLNPDGSVSPAQAESVSISDDRKTYTFHLRESKWSDGTAVTAADFEYSWKKILSPDFPAANAHLLYPLKNGELAKRGLVPLNLVGVRATDAKTLIVELENPTPYFLDLISFCVFFPVNQAIDEAGTEFISNGPFKLARWKHNNEMIFEKNRHYWEAAQIDLDKIDVSIIPDENTTLTMYENGELDILGLGSSPLPTDTLLRYQSMGLLKTQSFPGTSILCFNVSKFPFTNKNIRKALAYAIDRQAIVDNVTQLQEDAATNIIPFLLNKNISYFKDHDVENARYCFLLGLQELDITAADFPTITYQYSHSELNHKLAQILQQQWHDLFGIKVNLQNNEHPVFLDHLKNQNFDIAQSFWVAQYYDPMSILERFKYKTNPKNYPGWEHPEFIRLLEKSALDPTPENRMKTLEEAETLFLEEMPLAPLYHWKTAFIIKDHLTYQSSSPTGAFDLTRIQVK